MSLDDDTLKRLADEVLTFIEQREAEQVAYGIYDVTMTGVEVIDNFQPSEDIPLAAENKTDAVRQALQYLANDLQIIRFDRNDSPSDWIFRSRIAETVRLIVKLRQRIVNQNNEKPTHRISKCKRLVSDVKFSVASRRVPRRNIVVNECLEPLLNGNCEQQQAAQILLEVINNSLPKLRSMSGFQGRTFESILQVIELSKQQGIEKGVVVTASTGAGKTYAFFLPILAKMIIERCLRGKIGVKAICIYPRVALSENQLTDFIEVLFHLNQVLEGRDLPTLTIGLESGAAVYQIRDFRDTRETHQKQLEKMRGWTFQDSGYLSPFAYCVGTSNHSCDNGKQRLIAYSTQPDALVCPACNKQYPFIQFARDVMGKHPPDLLIATTESLHRRLLSSKYQYLFGTDTFCAPSVVMLDEIHLQTSTAGTQVALLLRRLMARIRLGQKDRNESANLAFVGLSATIAEPPQFLSELSGVPVTRISHVTPHEEEMQTIGAERYIFVRAEENEDTAIISTLIQTAMCVLHTMPQPSQGRYRTFGFVQSLDLVGRWTYQMQDAEKVKPEQKQFRDRERETNTPVSERQIRVLPLYTYRFPPYNRQLFPNFMRTDFNCECDCNRNNLPNLECPLFQAGECWWVLSQNGKSRREPLNIKRKAGSDRAVIIEPDDDLVITTSALEVGYDDEDLMCVLQYQAPANVASFVQRKGRGGRKVGTRPIIITVLSPYKPTDLFLFRNEHLLTDPTFQKLPLNPQNRYLQRIHGFYAFFDWLAYRASFMRIELDLDRLYRRGYEYLMEQTANIGVLLEFKDYLQKTFAIPDDAISRVLGSENEGLLWGIFHGGLMKTVHPKFEQNNQEFVDARKFLNNHLPENLFSDINLPEVRVDYKPDNSSPNKKTNPESISLAISETIPGNVTFRGGEGSTWIPPEPSEDEITLITLSQYYQFPPNPINNPNTVNLPVRALKKVEIIPQSTRSIPLYRPTAINPTQFSRDYNSSFWWCNPENGTLNESRDPNNAAQDTYQLAHSTSAIPINAVDIQPIRRENSTPAYTFTSNHDLLSCDPFSKTLIQKIVFYSDELENLNLLTVQRLILGSEYTIKFHQSAKDEIRGVVGFKANEDEPLHCALGYELITDGISIDLNANRLQNLTLSTSSLANLQVSIVRHAFITKLTVESEYRENYFAAENLVNVLLTIANIWCGQEQGTAEKLKEWFTQGNDWFEREFREAVNQIHKLSQKKQEAIQKLVSSENDYLSIFLDIYGEIYGSNLLYQQYLRDSFQYSITQALKQVAQEVAGVEALNYVAAWTELKVDFEKRASDRIYLYEIGMGGIGVMRATHNLLRKQPDRFWTTLAEKMTRCPTAKEESFLRYLLAQSEDWLEQCETWVRIIIDTSKSSDRQREIDNLLFQLRRQLRVPVRQAQLKSLLRVFIPDYTQEVNGKPIVNWRIFREINHQFLPNCAEELNRDPSFTEARAMLYRKIYRARQEQKQILYPESYRLLQLYEEEYGTSDGDARKAFEGAVERRMLLNCRCSCSSCLDDRSSDIESPGLGRNLLNRPLLTEWLTQVRTHQTLEIAASEDAVTVCDRIRVLLENGYRVIYLRVNSENLSSLCATISYLTDAGIDTDTGMVYPAISDIQTIYSNDLSATQPPVIEVTVRPIQ
jgi:DEAD/DEAH box helicase/Helicase conserved C-terminal domain